jgi:hypothetical protein
MDVQATSEPSNLRIGTEQHYQWLHAIVKSVLVLNLIDALLTLFWVRAGLAAEANTLMDELVNENAVLFVLVKVSLVGMGSWLLWRQRQSPIAVVAIFVAFMTYYAILLYHLQYASSLVRSFF